MTDPQGSLVLEVIKHGNSLSMAVFENFGLSSTVRRYSSRVFEDEELKRLCQETHQVLSQSNQKKNGKTGLEAELKKLGRLLWDLLLTKPVKQRLSLEGPGDLLLCLDEGLIHIPWEVLFTGEEFLCLKFNLGRLIRSRGESAPLKYRSCSDVLKMLVLANPTGDLKGAYTEGISIRDQFDKYRERIKIDFKSTEIDRFYVKKVLHDYDIVHFAGHCEFDNAEPKESGWLMSDGRLSAQDIISLGESTPLPMLVFSNACFSASISGEPVDSLCQEKTYSLASAFLFSGVRHYIGSIFKIEDKSSFIFAQEVYLALIRGHKIGECIRLARKKLIRDYGDQALMWSAYILYGDPGFTFFKPRIARRQSVRASGINLLRRHKKACIYILALGIVTAFLIYLATLMPTINPTAYFLLLKSRRFLDYGRNQEAVATAVKIVDKEPSFCEAYKIMADAYHRSGDTENALRSYFDYAMYSEKGNNMKKLADAYISIGWFYHLKGEYPKARSFYEKAILISRDNRDPLNEAKAIRKIAVWHMDNRDYDKALELLTKSSEINHERQFLPGHKYNLACDYFDIGLVFSNKEDFDSAKKFYEKSGRIFKDLKLNTEMSDYYFNLGEMHMFDKEFHKALDCYNKGLDIDMRLNNRINLAGDYNMLGELYMEMDRLKDAESAFGKAVFYSREMRSQAELAEAYCNLGVLFKRLNLRRKFMEYMRLAQEIYWNIDRVKYAEIKEELTNAP